MKWLRRTICFILLLLLALFICMPLIILLCGSLTSSYELKEMLFPIIQGNLAEKTEYIRFSLLAHYPVLEHYGKLLFFTPQFFTVFWNSMKLVLCILTGQLLTAVPAAWTFGVYRFRCRKILFSVYIILMLMPFQVTMLSQYLVLNRMSLMNTHLAVILPAVFSAFPVFLIYQGFRQLPQGLFEAAKIDGAGDWILFYRIGLPLARNSVLSAVTLGFLEYWNLVEQPLTFLEDKTLWPLSLYLPEIGFTQAGFAFAAALLTVVPAGFVFLSGREYLEQGIVASALKE